MTLDLRLKGVLYERWLLGRVDRDRAVKGSLEFSILYLDVPRASGHLLGLSVLKTHE